MKKYLYRNKKTGEKVQSNVPLKDGDLILVRQIKDGRMKNNEVRQK